MKLLPQPGICKAVLISYDALSSYFHRVYSRPAPHNVYSSTQTILGAGLGMGLSSCTFFLWLLVFRDAGSGFVTNT